MFGDEPREFDSRERAWTAWINTKVHGTVIGLEKAKVCQPKKVVVEMPLRTDGQFTPAAAVYPSFSHLITMTHGHSAVFSHSL